MLNWTSYGRKIMGGLLTMLCSGGLSLPVECIGLWTLERFS
jgi:hypothetical protein